MSGDFCAVAEPLRPDGSGVVDYLVEHDPALARAILAHNRIGEDQCGWKP